MTQSASEIVSIDRVEQRSTLYYGRYKYRARVGVVLANRITPSTTTLAKFRRIIKDEIEFKQSSNYWNRPENRYWVNRFESIDYDSIGRYINWRNKNKTVPVSDRIKTRIEANVISLFSSDLATLQQIVASIFGDVKVDYTQIDATVDRNIVLFNREPKHRFRTYLRGKNLSDERKIELKNFIDRYKNTSNQLIPCPSLDRWLKNDGVPSWRHNYLRPGYFIDYDSESTSMILQLMLDDIILSHRELKQRPASS